VRLGIRQYEGLQSEDDIKWGRRLSGNHLILQSASKSEAEQAAAGKLDDIDALKL